MQFVADGPVIPDALLQAHEDGRVVFFCGSGISYPAGLPGFKGLVDEVYRVIGTTQEDIERDAYNRNQFDATLDLLERRFPGQRVAVRTALAKVLQPKLRRKGATDTHNALLQLARSRDGALRLVTTNFDRIFECVAKRAKIPINAYAAPMLPIPKNSRWNGLVYLHGLLSDHPDAETLNRLVLTSGDFGLAYLTERWAARFVGELFRNYIVCFAGYSINDPVLRYMMDALAADRMLGEVTPQAYALGDYDSGQQDQKRIEWGAKGVTPILYEVPAGTHDHSALHQTLKAWAETYRDGILGKERIVVSYAMARPSASTLQDDFVGRMLWALSHDSGLPAKRFADFNPAPPLEWLEFIAGDGYRHGDLIRFQVPPHNKADEELRFSLVRRPAPYTRAPWMMLVSGGASYSQWDDVMFHLARWLVRHLDDPALLLWLAQRGGQLHVRLAHLIEQELRKFSELERSGRLDELARIREQSPNAIVRPLLRPLWRLLLTGRIKSPGHELSAYGWVTRFKHDGLTATLRFELRELLAPRIAIKKPFSWGENAVDSKTPEGLNQLFELELSLAADHVHSSPLKQSLADSENLHSALPALLDDFQQLVRDALDLRNEIGDADDCSDRSCWDLPSISPHRQNQGFRDWVVLIELLRDAWLAIFVQDSSSAAQIANDWFDVPYPTFKRLALFAASHDGCIAPDQWVDWLVTDGGRWLWSAETGRETLRLLVLQGLHLTPQAQSRLEMAILTGPPRSTFRDDIDPEDWQLIWDHSVWLHLAKLQASGLKLGAMVAEELAALSDKHPKWRLADNESDEFSVWISGTGDPDFENHRENNHAPRKRAELVEWLKQKPQAQSALHDDTWRENCRTRFFHCALALSDLAREGQWPAGRWREAMQAWSEEGRTMRSWRFMAPTVIAMPNDVLREVAHNISWWLEAVSKNLDRHEGLFLNLCQRIVSLQYHDDVESGQPVSQAINHPVGRVTQAMLNLWFSRKPNDNDGLPADMVSFYTQLFDKRVAAFRHGRLLLASHLIALFRVDDRWTKEHLLPQFDWKVDPVEARAAWEGFLWSPRLYQRLIIAFKPQFLATASHYAELGEHARQFSIFLTYAGLEPADTFSAKDFQTAMAALPQRGLQEAAQALVQALEGAGEQREEYWTNRIQPFWQSIWPKSLHLASREMAETLARLSIAAGRQFPAALATVKDWLQPVEHPDFVVHLLREAGHPERFPLEALQLLDAVISDQELAPTDLIQCLKDIAQAKSKLRQDRRHQRLLEYAQRRGI